MFMKNTSNYCVSLFLSINSRSLPDYVNVHVLVVLDVDNVLLESQTVTVRFQHTHARMSVSLCVNIWLSVPKYKYVVFQSVSVYMCILI